MFKIYLLSLSLLFMPINTVMAEQKDDASIVEEVKMKIYGDLYEDGHLLHTIGLLMACEEDALKESLISKLESVQDVIEKALVEADIKEGLTGDDLDDFEIYITAYRTGYFTATMQMSQSKIKAAKVENIDYCNETVPSAYASMMKK